MTALLLGPDHPALGALATASAGPRTAVALSAGARPAAHHVEGNEDAALAAEGDGWAVLAVADGHSGAAAAVAAVRAIAAALPDAAPDRLLAAAQTAAASARRSDPRAPRCSLSVAVIKGGTLDARTVGDTAVLVGTRVVSGVAPGLGSPAPLPPPGPIALTRGDRVVLVTDGVYDALGPAWPATLATSRSAEHLVRSALTAGAADNLAAAWWH